MKGDELVIFLRQIDPSYFRDLIFQFSKQFSENEINILNYVAESIEKIKSYGLKGEKRIYVGYDREGKVKSKSTNT